jgi:tRNA-dihydrouridine synthase
MRAMVFPENQAELFHWVEAFCEQEIPLIIKFNTKSNRTLLQQVLEALVKSPLVGIHMNIREEKTKQPDNNFVRKIKELYPFFLLASGYIRSATDAKGLFEAGADMVGIAEPTIKDPGFISRLVAEYKAIKK